MTYDSPKQIRRRQQRAEDKPRRAPRKSTITVPTAAEWDRHCDGHIARLREWIDEGYRDAAGRQAQALGHMALERRALEIMRDFGRAYWFAKKMARVELYGEAA